jgi:hypothetical protein
MESADCKPDAADCRVDVLDPGFTCEPGLTVEQCLPDGVPADYNCVTLESDPIQVKCTPVCETNPPSPDGADTDLPVCTLPEECAQAGEADRCLPPDCAVSSDGSVACPGSEPCDPAASDCGSTEPGVACPEGVTPEECARGGSGGGTDAAPPDVDPAPAVEQ